MKRAFAISLAILMLTFNLGFSLNTHFCGGEPVKTSFTLGLHNPDCGMAKMEKKCGDMPANADQLSEKPCCENQHQMLQLDEDLKIQSSKTSINPVFVIAFVQVFAQQFSFVDQTFVPFIDYSPPLPDKNIQVLFQTFLI